jgi:cyclohexanone monooxygenase
MTSPNAAEHRHVVIIGAGPGGLSAAVQLQQAGYDDFVILDQAPRVGGTWHHNRYPGAECDVMSHCYSFGFDLNPDWTRTYAGQPEIQAYLARSAEKFGLGAHLRLSTRVTSLTWRQEDSQWQVVLSDGSQIDTDIVISALGMFNEPYVPAIPGIDSFAGETMHTARWPESAELGGKRVAVIGSAATAVQIVPELANIAGNLMVFQRTATWVLPKDDRSYTENEKEHFRRHPQAMQDFRDSLVERINRFMKFTDPEYLQQCEEKGLANLEVVEDPEVRALLTPRFPWGSRRPILSNKYYPAFNRDNVTLITDAIEAITPQTIRTSDGREREVDVIVFATGFAATKYLRVLDVTGRDGMKLDDAWADDAKAYLGVMTTGFPNLFMMYGPNTNNGSIITMLEYAAEFVVRHVRHIDNHNLGWIDVRRDVMDAYNSRLQADLNKVAVWNAERNGYYRGDSGRIVTQWPYTMNDYRRSLQDVELTAFDHRLDQ